MKARMEQILTRLAQRYAVYLLQEMPKGSETPLSWLADRLAKNGILVIAGDIPGESYENQVSEWIGVYGDLYRNLTRALFPSYTGLDAMYGDDMKPPIVIIKGECAPVIQAIGRYIVPYVALRKEEHLVSEAELRGVMTFILDDLEANDLANEMYTMLWQGGAQGIRRLLQMPITQYAVTSFSRPLFQNIQQSDAQAQVLPGQAEEPDDTVELPDLLPDQQQAPAADPNTLFTSSIPIFFSGRHGKGRRRPPVPMPPDLDTD